MPPDQLQLAARVKQVQAKSFLFGSQAVCNAAWRSQSNQSGSSLISRDVHSGDTRFALAAGQFRAAFVCGRDRSRGYICPVAAKTHATGEAGGLPGTRARAWAQNHSWRSAKPTTRPNFSKTHPRLGSLPVSGPLQTAFLDCWQTSLDSASPTPTAQELSDPPALDTWELPFAFPGPKRASAGFLINQDVGAGFEASPVGVMAIGLQRLSNNSILRSHHINSVTTGTHELALLFYKFSHRALVLLV